MAFSLFPGFSLNPQVFLFFPPFLQSSALFPQISLLSLSIGLYFPTSLSQSRSCPGLPTFLSFHTSLSYFLQISLYLFRPDALFIYLDPFFFPRPHPFFCLSLFPISLHLPQISHVLLSRNRSFLGFFLPFLPRFLSSFSSLSLFSQIFLCLSPSRSCHRSFAPFLRVFRFP